MLSILIPTYNHTCYTLVADLQRQAEVLDIPYEIIVTEDGSRDSVSMLANLKIGDLPHCRYILRRENVGRAAIRNFLMKESQGDRLLFIDSDAKVINDDFLRRYIDASEGHDIVCGGVIHPQQCKDPSRMLRWKYEKDYERRHGYVSEQFRSFSFLISRNVADKVRFDERYRKYGYEDVQFGKDLLTAGFKVHSIDNPLLNTDIETNDVFLHKTEEALQTARLFHTDLGERIGVIRMYDRLRLLSPLMQLSYRLFAPLIRRNLLSSSPSLTLFAAYKLCYYSTLCGKNISNP